jgi:phosphoribosylformylglycinamidine synthase
VPRVDARAARQLFAAVHRAIEAGLVRACHDLSEGGLAVAAAEMAFAGGLGARISLAGVPCDGDLPAAVRLFSESNTRFLCEVRPADAPRLQETLGGIPHARIGTVTSDPNLAILDRTTALVEAALATLKEAWQKPLRW